MYVTDPARPLLRIQEVQPMECGRNHSTISKIITCIPVGYCVLCNHIETIPTLGHIGVHDHPINAFFIQWQIFRDSAVGASNVGFGQSRTRRIGNIVCQSETY